MAQEGTPMIPIGENDLGYRFVIVKEEEGRWVGYADSDAGAFVLPGFVIDLKLGIEDRERAIKLAGAVAQAAEHGYGGVDRWFIAEELRGRPEDFRCEKCDGVGCPGDCDVGAVIL